MKALRFSCGRRSLFGLLFGCRCGFLWLVLLGGRSLLLVAIGRGPQSEVVTQQLHDESAVAIALLRKRIELRDGIIEGLLGKMAGTIGRVQDLVVENGEVECETEADRVSRSKIGLSDIGSVLIIASC